MRANLCIRVLFTLGIVLVAAPTVRAGGMPSHGHGRFSAPRPGTCARQTANRHVPGMVFGGRRLGGLAADPDTGHVFVLSCGDYAAGGKNICATSLFMLNGWNGRLLHSARISRDEGPATFDSLAVDSAAHLVLAVDSGQPATVGVPGARGSLNFLDTRTGALIRAMSPGMHPSAVAVDDKTYRAFVIVQSTPTGQTGNVAMVAVTRGTLLKTITYPAQAIAVDQSTNRVFLLSAGQIVMLDGASGAALKTIALPQGYYTYNGFGLDEQAHRLLMVDEGLAPPHSGNPGNPPSFVVVVDTRNGALVRTVTQAPGILAGKLLVDGPNGITLSADTNTDSTDATVLDTTTGDVRGRVTLPLPRGGLQGPSAVDPASGATFTYTYRGIRQLFPGSWQRSRTVSNTSDSVGYALTIDMVTHRIFGLQLDLPNTYSVRAYCINPSCR